MLLNTPSSSTFWLASASAASSAAMAFSRAASTSSCRFCFCAVANAVRSSPSTSSLIFSFSPDVSAGRKFQGSLAAFSASLMMALMTGWKPRWPNITASSICASGSSLASDSTIITASCVPAMTRSSALLAISSSSGLSTRLPLTRPTRAAPIGPRNGRPDSVSAADAATMPTISGSFSRSCDSTVTTTWVSFLKPSRNNGRTGRSIRREVSVSFSLGLPSRLKKPPGILPAAYVLSW